MTLAELMPEFAMFYCKKMGIIDGQTLYMGKTYPIAIDKEKGRVRIYNDDKYLFSTINEIRQYGEIE